VQRENVIAAEAVEGDDDDDDRSSGVLWPSTGIYALG
jgi:hypothetical protein